MKKLNLTNVKEAGDFPRMQAGPYICKICKVEDFTQKEYLKVTYDICEGELAGHFEAIRKEHPDWAWTGAYVKSYKAKALPMFKRFCSAVSNSNQGFVFDGNVNADEQTLIGKKLGLLFGEEEYYGNDGNKKTRLIVAREFPVDKLAEQKTPAVKKVAEPVNVFQSTANDDDDAVPFE